MTIHGVLQIIGVCEKTDSINRSGIGWCWDCLGWLLWGYRVSCLVTIFIKDRSYGIDLYTEERRVYTSGPGLVGNPMRPYDAISVYTMMNENFKGGLNNVMLRNKDPVDSRQHQRCVDNRHEMVTRVSVYNKPIRVKGRFGCLYSPVRDADWSDVCSVDLSPVGDVWIEYIGDEFDQKQSTDAAPLTELQDLYTLLNRGRNLIRRMIAPQKKCSQWATVPHGRTGDHQRRPEYPHSNRCSLWLSEWGMRCDPSADRLMLHDSSLEVDHLSARTGGSVPSHGLDVITRSFGASVVASLVTCSHVVPNRTRPCRLNQLVGSSSLKETDREMEEIRRKTHPRPGPHPPWSTCASFDPHSSFSHQIIMGFIITE